MPHHALQTGQWVAVINVDANIGEDVSLTPPNGNTGYELMNGPLPDQLLPVGGMPTPLLAGHHVTISVFNDVIVFNHGPGQLDVDW